MKSIGLSQICDQHCHIFFTFDMSQILFLLSQIDVTNSQYVVSQTVSEPFQIGHKLVPFYVTQEQKNGKVPKFGH